MAAEEVLKLFDFYWFEHGLFTKKPPSPPPPPSSTSPVDQTIQELEESKLSRVPTLHVRSLSDQNLSPNTSFTSGTPSPNSVLHTPKLQTILSGKEIKGISDQIEIPIKKKLSDKRRGRKSSSKSLSALEFEELKGFMDLGFVFSEADKDSSLVSIIPGLQRLGRKGNQEDVDEEEETAARSAVSRPYLSEAWDVLDRRKEKNPLMNWRIPSLGNEIDMKDHLRFWAHTVASTVR